MCSESESSSLPPSSTPCSRTCLLIAALRFILLLFLFLFLLHNIHLSSFVLLRGSLAALPAAQDSLSWKQPCSVCSVFTSHNALAATVLIRPLSLIGQFSSASAHRTHSPPAERPQPHPDHDQPTQWTSSAIMKGWVASCARNAVVKRLLPFDEVLAHAYSIHKLTLHRGRGLHNTYVERLCKLCAVYWHLLHPTL